MTVRPSEPDPFSPTDHRDPREETTPARLSTCGTCGGTIIQRPAAVYGWGHVSETPRNADGHRPEPDDGYVSGPDRDDREPCNACGHPGHDYDHDGDEGCGAVIGSGRYGSDGIEAVSYCRCTGPVPARCGLCGRVPAEGEAHRQLYGVGDTGEDAEEVCVGPDRRQLDYATGESYADPWLDPDAAARAVPPPF